MAEQKTEKRKPRMNKRIRKRLWCAATLVIVALFVLGLLWLSGRSGFKNAEEKLAAIDAERAIPDEQNAAMVYNQLVDDYDEGTFSRDFLAGKTDTLTMGGPWLSKDHPEVAEWLKEQQGTISKLLEACKKEECRFPISIDPQVMADRMQLLRTMRRWAYLLVRAGNNDVAEGRVDAGLEKYLCLIQMGKQLRQQPVIIDYLVGVAIEALGLEAVAHFTVEGGAAETHLKLIESAMPQTKDNWAKELSIILEVEQLNARRQSGSLAWLISQWWWRISNKDAFDRMHEMYVRLLTDRRGNRILIALRGYNKKTGNWPESLDEIKSSLPEESLVDPSNNGSFVYMLTDDGFRLYGKGQNGIDENGRRGDGADDWLIWPRRGRKSEQKSASAG